MASITISVPAELAAVYDAGMVARIGVECPLIQLMDEISDRAAARGLTPEILEK